MREQRYVGHIYAWEKYVDRFEEIKIKHFEELMTIGQISKELRIPEWIILELFEKMKMDKLSYKELTRRKRSNNFDKIYTWHFKQKLSMNEIYRRYGYSQPYCRRVLADKGLKQREIINQHS
ncbi:AraC family transcriptional regulator [Oceanobacillus kimchii]|uniref:Uncharacterized protein n=1 Tax=Oceanobacillus kimchii TaxID=746691 RepID=A0ABQ5TLW7_9BACI|nr:AraC family transcriptional regulator [Oceanobacillus kimchii]GLO66100.1 hypothetical protein MACH08_18840 [Oceanobacillus kimchii]